MPTGSAFVDLELASGLVTSLPDIVWSLLAFPFDGASCRCFRMTPVLEITTCPATSLIRPSVRQSGLKCKVDSHGMIDGFEAWYHCQGEMNRSAIRESAMIHYTAPGRNGKGDCSY